jgi:glutamate-1-semialdehyde 2,1-aminomutase
VVAAVRRQAGRSTHPGACHELEVEWAERVVRLVPSAERVRFTGSGTEATLMALRLARMATGKPKVLKFVGHFHGWHDAVMPGAYAPYDGSPVPGIPAEVQAFTVVVPPNDPDLVERTLAADPDIGVVILEPTGGHWGAVPVRGPFLHALRDITARLGRLLIFDEVITGFRVHPGGAQGHYGITPDLTTLAKVLAGGLPGGAVAGRADLLGQIEVRPGRPKMRHPGTFNANPLSAAAGVAALDAVADGSACRAATAAARDLRARLNRLFAEGGWPWVAYGEFSLFRILPAYTGQRPDPKAADPDAFTPYDGSVDRLDSPKSGKLVHAFRQALLLAGVDMPGLGGFLSAAHTEADITRTVEAVGSALRRLAAEGLAG